MCRCATFTCENCIQHSFFYYKKIKNTSIIAYFSCFYVLTLRSSIYHSAFFLLLCSRVVIELHLCEFIFLKEKILRNTSWNAKSCENDSLPRKNEMILYKLIIFPLFFSLVRSSYQFLHTFVVYYAHLYNSSIIICTAFLHSLPFLHLYKHLSFSLLFLISYWMMIIYERWEVFHCEKIGKYA